MFVPLSHCTTLILPSIPIDEYSLSSTRMPRPPDLKKLPRPPILHLFKHILSSTPEQKFLHKWIEPFSKYNYVRRRETSAHLYESVPKQSARIVARHCSCCRNRNRAIHWQSLETETIRQFIAPRCGRQHIHPVFLHPCRKQAIPIDIVNLQRVWHIGIHAEIGRCNTFESLQKVKVSFRTVPKPFKLIIIYEKMNSTIIVFRCQGAVEWYEMFRDLTGVRLHLGQIVTTTESHPSCQVHI